MFCTPFHSSEKKGIKNRLHLERPSLPAVWRILVHVYVNNLGFKQQKS